MSIHTPYHPENEKKTNHQLEKIYQEQLDTEKTFIENLLVLAQLIPHLTNPQNTGLLDASALNDQDKSFYIHFLRTVNSLIPIHQALAEQFEKFNNHTVNENTFDKISALSKLSSLYIGEWAGAYEKFISINEKFSLMKSKSAPFKTNAQAIESLLTDASLNKPSHHKITELLSFTIMPIQRFPRYEMLNQDILKHLPKDNAHYDKFSQRKTQLKELTTFINNKTKLYQQAQNFTFYENEKIHHPRLKAKDHLKVSMRSLNQDLASLTTQLQSASINHSSLSIHFDKNLNQIIISDHKPIITIEKKEDGLDLIANKKSLSYLNLEYLKKLVQTFEEKGASIKLIQSNDKHLAATFKALMENGKKHHDTLQAKQEITPQAVKEKKPSWLKKVITKIFGSKQKSTTTPITPNELKEIKQTFRQIDALKKTLSSENPLDEKRLEALSYQLQKIEENYKDKNERVAAQLLVAKGQVNGLIHAYKKQSLILTPISKTDAVKNEKNSVSYKSKKP